AAAHCSAAGPTAGTPARRTAPTATRSAATAPNAIRTAAAARSLGVGQGGEHGRKRYRRRDHQQSPFHGYSSHQCFPRNGKRVEDGNVSASRRVLGRNAAVSSAEKPVTILRNQFELPT